MELRGQGENTHEHRDRKTRSHTSNKHKQQTHHDTHAAAPAQDRPASLPAQISDRVSHDVQVRRVRR